MLIKYDIIENKHILFNGLKHHIQTVQQFMEVATPVILLTNLLKIGGSQMDFYKGDLTENQIFDEILVLLRGVGVATQHDFKTWVAVENGFQVLTLSDNSTWVLRLSDKPQQFMHVHPARYSPQTVRVKAGTLKTCIALAVLDPDNQHLHDLTFFNQIRVQVLGLSPIKKVEDMNLLQLLLKEIMSN